MISSRIFMTTDAVGGVWSYALELARGLSSVDVETTLAVLGPAPDAAQLAEAQSISGLRLLETGLPLDWDIGVDAARLTAAGAIVADLALDCRADVIHLNSPILAGVTRFSAPVVGVCHSCLTTWWHAVKGAEPLPAEFVWRGRLLKDAYQRCQALVAPSLSFAVATAAAYGLPARPLVVHNGRNAGGPGSLGDATIFTCGRLWDEGKNAATLDRVAALLDMPIYAAGNSVSPDGATSGFDHLRMLGWLNDGEIAQRLSGRPIFVSVSRYEPFGLAVLEAALAGCALVLSDIPTFRELWRGVANFVPADDAAAIAFAIRTLIERPALREKQGLEAAKRGASYSSIRMTRRMLALYAGVSPALRAVA